LEFPYDAFPKGQKIKQLFFFFLRLLDLNSTKHVHRPNTQNLFDVGLMMMMMMMMAIMLAILQDYCTRVSRHLTAQYGIYLQHYLPFTFTFFLFALIALVSVATYRLASSGIAHTPPSFM